MGIFGQIAQGFLEGIADSMNKAADESKRPRPGFRCQCNVKGEIKWDSDYLRAFTEALADFAEKNPDSALAQKLEDEGNEAVFARFLKYKDDHCSLWEVTYGTDDDKPKTIFDTPRNAVNIVFNTPDAIQKTREGERLNEADVVFYCVDIELEEKYRDDIASKRRQIAAIPPLDAFLGVKFGDDPQKYQIDDKIVNEDDDDGSIIIRAKVNHFLNFNEAIIIVSRFSRKVVGVICHADKSDVDDVEEFTGRVCGLLEKKYGVKAIIERDSTDEDDEDDEDSTKMHILPFYDAEKWNPNNPIDGLKSSIALFSGDDCITMFAKDEIAYNEMIRQNERFKKEKAKREREAAIEKRRRDDEDALDAL